jgi:DNA polymerase-3 subunit alpha
VSNPDIDMDIDDSRRHEVVEYTIDRYGKEQVGRIIAFGTLAAKAAIKNMCRALDIPNYKEVGEMISDAIPAGKVTLEEALKDSELLRGYAASYPQVFDMAKRAEGKTSHTSVHAAGVVIAPEPMEHFVPLYFTGDPSKREAEDWEPTTCWDMYDCEERGLMKMDYLGLKTLKVIDRTVELINDHRQFTLKGPRDFDIDTIDRWDDKAWKMIAEGKTSGVFQVERTYVRNFMKRMNMGRKDEWQLAVILSIIRPGMMDAGMTGVYLDRAAGQEAPVPIHPKLEKTLKDTFGLLVFQEDCMWVARDLAGFCMAEADTLRRAIAKKKPKDMAAIHPVFIAGCVKHSGISEAEAEDVWHKMATFARYGFNNAHAAAYGLIITYQTVYLKANYPLFYMTALIDSESGVGDKEKGYNAKVAEYVEEAAYLGLKVVKPSVLTSRNFCRLDPKTDTIVFGLEMIKDVSHSAATWITKNWRGLKSFKDCLLACFDLRQVPTIKTKGGVVTEELAWKPYSMVGKSSLEGLIFAGAFDVFDADRDKLLAMLPHITKLVEKYWGQVCKLKNGSTSKRVKPEETKLLIDEYRMEDEQVEHCGLEKRLDAERQATGCYLSDSPFAPYRKTIEAYSTCTSEDVNNNDFGRIGRFAGILRDFRVAVVKSGKSRGEDMAFMSFIGVEANVEVVAFADIFAKVKSMIGPNGESLPLERGKAYMVDVTPGKEGKSAILASLTRLSNTIHAAA